MKLYALRLRKNEDLMLKIKEICTKNKIQAGTVLSGVGCLYEARIRDASGVDIHPLKELLEILSLNGTVSENRVHLHISCGRKDLSVIGGHLCEGCLINTTCELVIAEPDGYVFDKEFDEQTGYSELLIKEIK